jgi:BirA family biotin operon repressor/biotin-[acetyl-CoA-carboxylase] ligase
VQRVLLEEEKLKNCLKENRVAVGNIFCYDAVTSTMDIAFALAEEETKNRTIIIARQQNRGRGRFNRVWYPVSGALYASLVLTEYDFQLPYSMLAAYAVYSVFKKLKADVLLKWINDVTWSNGLKIAGILTEESSGRTVIGIGVNLNNKCFPKQLKESATSYFKETGRKINPIDFYCFTLAGLLPLLDAVQDEGVQSILHQWETASDIKGRKVRVISESEEVRGVVEGINLNSGALIVSLDGHRREIFDGSLYYE